MYTCVHCLKFNSLKEQLVLFDSGRKKMFSFLTSSHNELIFSLEDIFQILISFPWFSNGCSFISLHKTLPFLEFTMGGWGKGITSFSNWEWTLRSQGISLVLTEKGTNLVLMKESSSGWSFSMSTTY